MEIVHVLLHIWSNICWRSGVHVYDLPGEGGGEGGRKGGRLTD